MTWKQVLALVVVLGLLAWLGPIAAAGIVKGIGAWLETFFTSF